MRDQAKKCGECKHYMEGHGKTWRRLCAKGHRPNWYEPKVRGDYSGHKRKCDDFEEPVTS